MRETHAELEQSRDESVRRQQQINDLTAKNEDLTVQVGCLWRAFDIDQALGARRGTYNWLL